MSQLTIVIRAGGTGTRLWPLSTSDIPKQFVPVLSEKSLLQETFERVREFGVANIFVTTNARHVSIVHEQLPDLSPDHIIAEPLKRNTGPGVAFETAVLAARFGDMNPVVASIPSDDFVGNADAFVHALHEIANYLDREPEMIVMPLVTPELVDPGYTYVRSGFVGASPDVAQITDWVEKPDPELCGKMLASGEWFAHTGMYVWKLHTACLMFEQTVPGVWARVCQMRNELQSGNVDAALQHANELPIISVESMVTKLYPHKAGYRSDDWDWSDVGKWTVVKELLKADEKNNASSHGQVHFVNAQNNLVYGQEGRRVVCVGISDLVIVDRGGHLLVCRIEEAHNVGAISEELSKLEKI